MRGVGMYNLAYIGATVLNFGLAWPADVCAAKMYKKNFKNMAQMYAKLHNTHHPSHMRIL